jgi:hypothetical protein
VVPYLVGEDLNQRADASPSRFVINFRDWSEEQARIYEAPFERVERLVKAERQQKGSGNMRERWWLFERARPELYRRIAPLDRCIVITVTSRTVQPVTVPTGVVFAHKLVVFAYDDESHFGLLSSAIHREWAIARGSTMRTDPNYTSTDCFETFVQPDLTRGIGVLGGQLQAERSAVMLARQEGLTTTYNRVHDPNVTADEIVRLRELHLGLDRAVRDAYGWSDLDLGYDFHATRIGTRFTLAPRARQEVLDRLLELNHKRYADEVRRGLHGKPKGKGRRKPVADRAMTLGFDGV